MKTTMTAKTDFMPAAHWHFLTPFYGPFMKLFFRKRYLKISDLITLEAGENLLDLGCGPGFMLELMHRKYPNHEMLGLDVDPKILLIARKKLPQEVVLVEGSADALPFSSDRFSVVTSTLMIHHLSSEQKQKMIREVFRVLKPGGRFYLFDFGPPTTWYGRLFTRRFRKIENLDEAMEGKYKTMMEVAGFKEIQKPYETYGMMELLKGVK